MYAFIKGTLVEASPSEAVVEAYGVGYRLLIPISHFGKLPQIGEETLLYTSFVVREQSQTLFGFMAKEERALFEVLITISGVGPKTALGIIGHLSLEALHHAVERHDCATLSKVPGIGRKTAERLLIDLRGRFKLQPALSTFEPISQLSDALQALIQLGYTQGAAEKAVKKAADTLPSDHDLPTLITTALKF